MSALNVKIHEASAKFLTEDSSPKRCVDTSKQERQRSLPIAYRDIPGIAAALDFLLVLLSIFLAELTYSRFVPGSISEFSREVAGALFVGFIYTGTMRLRGFYSPVRLVAFRMQIPALLLTWCGSFFLFVSGIFAWGQEVHVSRGDLLLFWAYGGLLLFLHHGAWRLYLPRVLKAGALRGPNAAIVAWSDSVRTPLRELLRRHGYSVCADFDMSTGSLDTPARFEAFIEALQGSAVDEVFLFARASQAHDVAMAVEQLRVLPLPVTLIPVGTLSEFFTRSRYELGAKTAVELQRAPLSTIERMMKRSLDLLVSTAAIVCLFPLLIVVALAIRLDSPGSILFRQTRRGFNGRPFQIFKFRSMKVEENGPVVTQATANDHRVTRVGYWLRRLSIDELPQIFNVFLGEMSIVGPRPHAVAHDAFYSEVVENYFFRHHVKAGITGWAQVNGARGETDTVDKMERRVELDIWYINHWSVLLDAIIILRTIGVVFGGRNAY